MQDTAAYVLIVALFVLPIVLTLVSGFEALLVWMFQNQLLMLVTPL